MVNTKIFSDYFYIIEIPLHLIYAFRKLFQSLLVFSGFSDRLSFMLENSDFVLGLELLHLKVKLK